MSIESIETRVSVLEHGTKMQFEFIKNKLEEQAKALKRIEDSQSIKKWNRSDKISLVSVILAMSVLIFAGVGFLFGAYHDYKKVQAIYTEFKSKDNRHS